MDGVEARHGVKGGSIRLHFSYRGVTCRETLKLSPTKANLLYAERLRGQILNAIGKGDFNYQDFFPESKRGQIFGHTVSTHETVDQRLTKFMAGIAAAVELGNMSPSTQEGYRKLCDNRLRPAFGKVQVAALNGAQIRDWVKGLGVSAKTARNSLSVLSMVLADAVNDGLIAENPVGKIDAARLLQKTARKSTYSVEPFTNDEVAKILAKAGPCAPLFKFAFATGLRTSELIALEWGDIDRAAALVHVRRAQVEGVVKGTKTNAGRRSVELSPEALAALDGIKTTSATRVFIHPGTGRPFCDDSSIRKVWTPIVQAAGVRYRNPYQTRHTFASRLLSDGANPWKVAQQMGHKTVEMIFRSYGRWIPEEGTESIRPNRAQIS
jgi:integrase